MGQKLGQSSIEVLSAPTNLPPLPTQLLEQQDDKVLQMSFRGPDTLPPYAQTFNANVGWAFSRIQRIARTIATTKITNRRTICLKRTKSPTLLLSLSLPIVAHSDSDVRFYISCRSGFYPPKAERSLEVFCPSQITSLGNDLSLLLRLRPIF